MTPRPVPRRRAASPSNLVALALALTLTLASLAGCAGSGTGSATDAAPACVAPPSPVLPETAGSLDETSTGAYCLAPDATIAVFLHAGAASSPRWTAITSSNTAVLAPRRTGVLTPPVGVTPGIFGAVATGTATLTSSTPDGRDWTVTVVVR